MPELPEKLYLNNQQLGFHLAVVTYVLYFTVNIQRLGLNLLHISQRYSYYDSNILRSLQFVVFLGTTEDQQALNVDFAKPTPAH